MTQIAFAEEFFNKWDSGDESFTLTTSGTTGTPKNWELHRNALVWSAESTKNTWLTQQNSLAQDCFLPVNKAGGFMQLVRSKVWNAPINIYSASANPLLEQDPTNPITSFTPMQLANILSHKESMQKLKSYAVILIGGQAITADLESKLLDVCSPKALLIHTFGSTETASHFAGRILNKVGNPLFQITLGTEIKTNPITQQLEIKNPTTQNQWLTTNDLVEIVNDNQFIWLGRKDLIINSGGVKIQIEVLENQIALLTGWPLGTFYVKAKLHPELGECVALYTLHQIDKDLLEIQLQGLPKFHHPKHMEMVNKIPLTETGKVKR